VAQGGEEGHRLPMAVGRLGLKPLAAQPSSAPRRHIGLELVEGWPRSHR
jgi:hypothetical protein